MAFTLYTSDDTGAPVLSGTVGTLVDVLHACLVTGYGTKPAAGWSRPWVDANGRRAVFKPNDPQDCFFHFHDDGPNSGIPQEANFWMGSAHDGAGTLSNTAPQNIGYTPGWGIRKSSAAGSAARDWKMYADGKTALLFIFSPDSGGGWRPYLFGKVLAISPAEVYPWVCSGRTVWNSTTAGYLNWPLITCGAMPNAYNNAATPFFADGAATGLGLKSAHLESLRVANTTSPTDTFGTGAPGARTGLLPLWDGLLLHDREPRFRLRGISAAYSGGAISDGDTFSATINGVLRTFQQNTMNAAGAILIETSDTLDL